MAMFSGEGRHHDRFLTIPERVKEMILPTTMIVKPAHNGFYIWHVQCKRWWKAFFRTDASAEAVRVRLEKDHFRNGALTDLLTNFVRAKHMVQPASHELAESA